MSQVLSLTLFIGQANVWYNIHMKRTYILVLLIFCMGLLYQYGWYGYVYLISTPAQASIDVSQIPEMNLLPEDTEFIDLGNTSGYHVLLEPVRSYDISGKVLFSIDTRSTFDQVVGIEAYDSKNIPLDLFIAWGSLLDYEYAIDSYHLGVPFVRQAILRLDAEKIQKRGGSCDYETCCDGQSVSYCYGHNHIIPANKSILITLKYLAKKGKAVRMQGYLVNVRRERLDDNAQPVISETSTVIGDYNCEIFYVEKVQIGSRVVQ